MQILHGVVLYIYRYILAIQIGWLSVFCFHHRTTMEVSGVSTKFLPSYSWRKGPQTGPGFSNTHGYFHNVGITWYKHVINHPPVITIVGMFRFFTVVVYDIVTLAHIR